MRIKSLQTAAEAAGYAMAPIEDDLFDDDAAVVQMTSDHGVSHAPVPDAAPRFHAPVVVPPYPPKSYAEVVLRSLSGFGNMLTRRATA